MPLNERLTTLLLILKVVFWCILIYTAAISAFFVRDTSTIIKTRLERGEAPFRLDTAIAGLNTKETAQVTLPELNGIKDPQVRAQLDMIARSVQDGNQDAVVSSLVSLDGVLASKGLDEARSTNQALLAAAQAGDEKQTRELASKLIMQLSS